MAVALLLTGCPPPDPVAPRALPPVSGGKVRVRVFTEPAPVKNVGTAGRFLFVATEDALQRWDETGAVMTMTRGMAKEFAPAIRVNAVCPGMIDTDFHNVFTKPEVRTHVAGATPLKREGRPEEVADLVHFLASDEASFLTGACVDINGGTYFS